MLGAGPGGYTAAFRAADLGLKTILVERYERLGGVCLNVGCIPSKALLHAARVISEAQEMGAHGIHFEQPHVDLDALRSWKQSVVDKLTGGLEGLARQRKVEVVHGSAQFTGPNSIEVGDRTITFDNCIIAAARRPHRCPHLPDDQPHRHVDGRARAQRRPRPAAGDRRRDHRPGDGDRLRRARLADHGRGDARPAAARVATRTSTRPLSKRISERYDAILLETKVEAIESHDDGLHVKLSNGDLQTFDAALVAVGRIPNGRCDRRFGRRGSRSTSAALSAVDSQMRTNVAHIYAIGDVVGGPMLAHKASHEGKVAAEVIAGVPGASFDPRAIPSVAYTDPEVAWMGLTETAAKADGIEYEKAVIPWSVSGRALGLGRAGRDDEAAVRARQPARARRRDRRRQRGRADRRDRPRHRDGLRRRGHRR